jgi:hypothetical protein
MFGYLKQSLLEKHYEMPADGRRQQTFRYPANLLKLSVSLLCRMGRSGPTDPVSTKSTVFCIEIMKIATYTVDSVEMAIYTYFVQKLP